MTTEPMTVARVPDDTGSHIEPPLDNTWSNHDQLRWHLAVVLNDAGAPQDLITIEPGHLTVGGIPQECYVLVLPGGRYLTTGAFHSAWNLINGIGEGLRIAGTDPRA